MSVSQQNRELSDLKQTQKRRRFLVLFCQRFQLGNQVNHRITSLTVVAEDKGQLTSHIHNTLEVVYRGLIRNGFSATLSSTLSSDVTDKIEDDSKKMLTFEVHKILCRLGMTETEAHNAIMQINDAGIKFVKE